MSVKDLILKEFVKNGYSRKAGKREWVITNPTLLFATSELAKAYVKFNEFKLYRSAVVEPELFLIKKNASLLRKSIGYEPFNLIDLSSVTGEHASAFLTSLNQDRISIRYCPVGMHPSLCKKAAANIHSRRFQNIVSYKLETSHFEDLVDLPSRLRNAKFQRNVIFLMGSVLASFELNDFLFQMSRNMFPGDAIVMGNGLRKGPRLVHIDTYRRSFFNSWFINIIKELGFSEHEVTYDARFGNQRVECFYTLTTDKILTNKGKKIEFKKGDEIRVAVIYKYYESELRKICKRYFSRVDFLKDSKDEYCLIVCRK